jgi:uncharacterized protein with GYD domain
MAYYLLQTAYTPQGWAAMLRHPHDRLEAIRPAVQRLGGRILSGWLTFGEYDALLVCELPDNTSAAALSMAVSAGGAVRSTKTTALLTFEEGVAALRKATDVHYTPPPSEVPYFGA